MAKAVAAAYAKEYQLDIVENFTDIPGYGVEADIGGNHVILASRELYSGRGVKLPDRDPDAGQCFHMTIAGKYVGRIIISSAMTLSIIMDKRSRIKSWNRIC